MDAMTGGISPSTGIYRPDIDGLRAIAVLSVVLHHLHRAWLPGGFIGVDIFFVISGFLITSHIVQEIRSQRFSIQRFYQRRINRIVPALVVVLVSTLAIGGCLLSPHDLQMLAVSAFSSIIGVANVFFWWEHGNYFAGDSGSLLLLHTWSLAVEEQFYVLWPWLLLALTRWFSPHLLLIGVMICGGGLVISEFGVNNFSSASYYLLPTRFFELAIGGSLVFFIQRYRTPVEPFNSLVGIVALGLIVVPLRLLTSTAPFPGFNALWPCVGAALVIWCGENRASRIANLLSNKLLVFFGLISYSLYLWHWPLLAAARYLELQIDGTRAAMLFAVAVLLSWLTWKFVELPWRRDGVVMSFRSVLLRRFVAPVGVLGLGALIVAQWSGFPQRFGAEAQQVAAFEAMVFSRPDELRAGCHVPTAAYLTPPDPVSCRLGAIGVDSTSAKGSAVDGLLIGDSYANHFTGMIDILARADGVTINDYTMDGCPPILDYDTGALPSYAAKCKARNSFVYEHLSTEKYSLVILAADWPPDDAAGLLVRRSIELLVANGAHVVVVLANPSIANASQCPVRALMYRDHRQCSAAQPSPAAYWGEIRRAFPTVSLVDPATIVCIARSCNPVHGDTLLYRDNGHLNDVGSRLIGKLLVARGVRLLEPAAAGLAP
jgi:peptidoglycan/LPS O-acetylase OafA/YrhL